MSKRSLCLYYVGLHSELLIRIADSHQTNPLYLLASLCSNAATTHYRQKLEEVNRLLATIFDVSEKEVEELDGPFEEIIIGLATNNEARSMAGVNDLFGREEAIEGGAINWVRKTFKLPFLQ